MNGPTFPSLRAAGEYGLANVRAGMAASFRLRRVVGVNAYQQDIPGIRLSVIKYGVVLLDPAGRIIEEYAA
jgi:hypothetical protein